MTTSVLPKLHSPPSLTERTYQVIRDAILSLELRPGEKLSVQRLSDQLGVSRTPVKEAFQRLEADLLVSVVPRRGTFVAPIRVGDIDEILEARALIEGFAASKAASRLSVDEFSRADDILARMEGALDTGNVPESAEIGHEFHLILIRHLDNARMATFLDHIDLHYTRIRRIFSHKASRQQQSLEEHGQILATLKSGDEEKAFRTMYRHHWSVRDELVAAFEKGLGDEGLEVGLPDSLISAN